MTTLVNFISILYQKLSVLYILKHVKKFDNQATLNEMLVQETASGMAIEFDEEEILGNTQITSVTAKEASTTPNRIANKEMNDTSLSATAELVCKTTISTAGQISVTEYMPLLFVKYPRQHSERRNT